MIESQIAGERCQLPLPLGSSQLGSLCAQHVSQPWAGRAMASRLCGGRAEFVERGRERRQ